MQPPPTGIFVGTSGWAYPSWKPGFYPKEVAARRFLEYYASRLNSVEVNYTFRRLPTASMLAGWMQAAGPAFCFSFKAPQRITHIQRLRESGEAVAELFAALEPVRAADRLGVILFQLPPNFKADVARLASFLAAPALAAADRPRVAFEFRHESWFCEEVYAILRKSDAALCIAESDDLATPDVQCASGHACYRLRRGGGATSRGIEDFAAHFQRLAASRDVFVYYRHEDEPTGALNAVAMLEACR